MQERLQRLLAGMRSTTSKRKLPGNASRARVESCHGARGRGEFGDEVDVLVCTYERANAVVNRLLDAPDGLTPLGVLVVDESHMIADVSRGFLIEQMLTKILAQRQRTARATHLSLRWPEFVPPIKLEL